MDTNPISLVDCNNFFASCEEVFQPKLRDKPVVVLSNNDGCIIARSARAKALGIPMAAPLWEWKAFCKQHQVQIFSANFTLYADMSRRVMSAIESLGLSYEPYSIDECFVHGTCAYEMKERIAQWTGIPVSVGVGSTKTQAKLANHIAKKGTGVHTFTPDDLKDYPIEDLWGVGRKNTLKLKTHGIYTAEQLVNQNDQWLRKKLSVMGLRLVFELRGKPCIEYAPEPKKSITASRSCRRGIYSKEIFSEAVMSFIARAARKLRKDKSKARYLMIFASPGSSAGMQLPLASSYNPTLMNAARKLIDQIYDPDITYKKIGVMLTDMTTDTQWDLLSKGTDAPELMEALDTLNTRYGKEVLFYGGQSERWKMPSNYRSPHYTTDWNDILVI